MNNIEPFADEVGLPEGVGSDVAADEDVGEVRAVSELDEGLELRSHEQRNGHDDGEKNKDDGKQSGNGSRQLLFVWLKYKTMFYFFVI